MIGLCHLRLLIKVDTVIALMVLLSFSLPTSLNAQQTKDDLLNNPNHIGGVKNAESSFDTILANKDQYSPQEVNNAYLNRASQMFMVDPDTLKLLFQEHLDYLKSVNMTELVGEVMCSQAELFYMTGNIQESLLLFQRAYPLLNKKSDEHKMANTRMGSILIEMNQLDSAAHYLSLFSDQVFEQGDTMDFLNAYQMQGELAIASNKYVTALDHYMNALKWSDYAVIPMRKADVIQKMANIYVALGDDENARKYLEQALQIAVDNNYNTMQNVLRTRLAHYELRLKNYDIAEEYLTTAEPYFLNKKRFNRVLECRTLLAHIYLKQNQFELAKLYLDQSEDILDKVGIEQTKYTYYQVRGLFYLNQNQLRKAEQYFLKAADLASKPMKSNAYTSSLEGLIDVYNELNDPISELYYTNKYHNFKDSIFNLKQSQLIYDYEGRYQKAEQDLAIAKLNEANVQQELKLAAKDKQLWISLIGVLAFLIIAIVSIRAYIQKKRSADVLKKKNLVIEKSLHANKMLLKEIHHRVKNNLQVVSSLLYLQSRFIKDDSAKGALNTGRARVQAMSILHQKLYQHDDIQKVEIKEYFKELGHNLFNTYKVKDKDIQFQTTLDDLALDVDLVIPMGLIANELISNALKHAFNDVEHGHIHLSITRDGKKVRLMVEDDGKGLPFNKLPENTDSLGVELIKSFADKLNAQIFIDNTKGTKVYLTFEAPELANHEILMYTESVAS